MLYNQKNYKLILVMKNAFVYVIFEMAAKK